MSLRQEWSGPRAGLVCLPHELIEGTRDSGYYLHPPKNQHSTSPIESLNFPTN